MVPRLAGVELGGTKCVCVLGDATGRIIETVRVSTTAPEATLAEIETVLDRWAPGFAALGIGCFGPIEVDPTATGWGHLAATPKPGWAGADVGARLKARYGVPAGLHTDVIGAALAEARWGAGRGLPSLAYVTVGTGVGVGIVSDGRPLAGFSHGELGHLRLARAAGDSSAGSCPYHGDCAEGLVAGPAIAARTGRTAENLAPDDPAWDLVVHTLGQLLHAIVVTAAPHRIVMGGGVMAQAHLLPRVRAALEASLNGYIVHPLFGAGLVDYVVTPGLGDRAGPSGALALADAAQAGRRVSA